MSELGVLQDSVNEVREDIKTILQQQATTAAKLDAIAKQSEAQIAVLFARRDKDLERVQRIELDYTPKREHAETKLRLDEVERRMWRWAGGLALVLIMLQLAGSALIRKVMG